MAQLPPLPFLISCLVHFRHFAVCSGDSSTVQGMYSTFIFCLLFKVFTAPEPFALPLLLRRFPEKLNREPRIVSFFWNEGEPRSLRSHQSLLYGSEKSLHPERFS